ncbi:MAG: twin-arginine translocase subunit TatC, partial [Tannerella sp.]|nr:twin-arginine translocase subunit TatC [Tannerella sp.]
IIIALLVFAIGGFVVMRTLFNEVIMAPCRADFITYQALCKLTQAIPFIPDYCDDTFNVPIFNIKLASQFFTHMSTSFWLALVLTFPYIMFEVWKFVRPALYDNERRNVGWAFSFGTLMFFIGCSVGYILVFPMTLRFLFTWELSSQITDGVSLDSYMDNFLMLIFIMGVVFEMPLISWLLSKLGLITRAFFNKYRRHAIAGLLIAAALITPSSDPLTLACVFFPLYGLYELSAFFVRKPTPEIEEKSTEIVKA